MRLICAIIVILNVIPSGKAFLEPLQKRDSILIADQLGYGFVLDDVKSGAELALPDFESASNDTLTVVRGWQLDTLSKPGKPLKIKASVIIAPFEEGNYKLPELPVMVRIGDNVDTLIFEAMEMEVKTMPVDTASFVIHDIKPLRRYPLTFVETLPWVGGVLVLAAITAAVIHIMRRRRRKAEELSHKDPAYIVALRKLDKYRGDKYWAPEKQKAFYSGITDALKEYMDDRFGVDAPEMTTAELFSALKGNKDLSPELFNDLKELFERADFVKFAKLTVSDTENAGALPLAVRFVTETHRQEIEEESNVL